ncbi:MAG: sodium:solute symporter family transporter, partial [Candidatus Binatia bacterium]
LASTTVIDFYKPLINPNASDEHLLKLSRWLTATWGIILIAIAFLARNWGSVFTVGLTIASLVYGTMLGAFLLGVLTKRANSFGVVIGMLSSISVMLFVKFWTELAWTWYVLLGTVICLFVGYTLSALFPSRTAEPVAETK